MVDTLEALAAFSSPPGTATSVARHSARVREAGAGRACAGELAPEAAISFLRPYENPDREFIKLRVKASRRDMPAKKLRGGVKVLARAR